MGLAAAGLALVWLVLLPLLPTDPSWLGGTAGIVVGGLVYFGLAYTLGVEELRVV